MSLNLHGNQYGKLVVTAFGGKRGRQPTWVCRCDCGTEKVILQSSLLRKKGASLSCGCLAVEVNTERVTRHGMSGSHEYQIWAVIKARCTNPSAMQWRYYGARGIAICDRWKADFANFYADMGPQPFKRASIDRINNDGPYAPENCRWSTASQQMRNTSKNVILEMNGNRLCIADWAEKYGIDYARLHVQIRRRGGLKQAIAYCRMKGWVTKDQQPTGLPSSA